MSNQEATGPGAIPLGKDLLQYGGQAVIEGVMMRSPRYFAVACRKADGSIIVQREEIDRSIVGKLKWLNKPMLRGTLALIDAMALGTRALRFASNVQLDDLEPNQGAGVRGQGPEKEGREEGRGKRAEGEKGRRGEGEPEEQSKIDNRQSTIDDTRHPIPDTRLRAEEEIVASAASIVNGPPVAAAPAMSKSGKINDIAIGGTLIFSLIAAILIFKLVPTWLTEPVLRWGWKGSHPGVHLRNAVDGIIRMILFFGYILAISQLQQIKRVFMYHGAEHKAINTLEAGLPLTRENALRASRIHPRCGTSFIFVVLLIDLIVIALLPIRPPLLERFALQVAVIPIVAGLAYELIKFAGKYRRNPLVMAIFAPGMATQYLTTREPDAAQTEVALASLYAVLEAEGHRVPQNADLSQDVPNPDEPAAVTA